MRRQNLFLILLAFISAGVYLALSASRGAVGFPLDDAWIHQVYARNLGTRGEFAFFAGQPSAGSTAPLWTIFLAVGYFLRIDFHAWTYVVVAMLMGASVILAGRVGERIFATRNSQIENHFLVPSPKSQTWLFAFSLSLFTLLEWHLSWSAVSGMEIPLFVFLSLLLLERFYARERAWLLGIIGALLTLTRPEGAVLAGIVAASVIARRIEATTKQSPTVPRGLLRFARNDVMFFGFGFAFLLAPYLLFNLAVSGNIFPNTFFAKNAEYQIIIERVPFVIRYLQLLFIPFIGAQTLLIPAMLFAVFHFVKRRNFFGLIPLAWILLLPALYALRLPVAYQHGRYEMPIIPFIVMYGIGGMFLLFERVKNFVFRATYALAPAATLIAFWFIGANAYATDVAIIDCEMVQTARWVAQNVPRDARVAAHDIGALGYYYDKPFIDLAGLVSPEVIPFIRDENRLREYLFSRSTQYAIFFPDWYPALDSDPRFARVFQTDCAVTRREGGTNMVVYKIVLTGK
ncbi:MAG: hypothetical protein HY257_06590 [Chloroflexi bacterium]|nr:hypothetical protein [Chloroflexota bacterium]